MFAFSVSTFSQTSEDLKNLQQLQAYEDTLLEIGTTLVTDSIYEVREAACVQFIPTLVKALKTPGSFHYPFDKLQTVSILNSPDEKFRIFTFQMTLWDNTYRYYGAIQYNTEQLKLTPLIDMSLFLGDAMDTVVGNKSWYGALYYNIIEKKRKGKKHYLLFGWDGNDRFSTKKLVDVLHFEGEEVRFGAPIFQVGDSVITRYIIQFKKEAQASINYDEEHKMILFDHLIPEHPGSEGIKMTYVPDGSYEGFKYKKGVWLHTEKAFEQQITVPPDNTPQPGGDDPWHYRDRGN